MIKYMRSHLTAKIFLITCGMLLAAAAITYGFIALYAPGQYLIAVEENLSQEAEGLLNEMKQANVEEAQELLEQFDAGYTVTLALKGIKGNLIGGELESVTVEAGADEEENVSENITDDKTDNKAGSRGTEDGQGEYEVKNKKPESIYEFRFKDSPDLYTLTIEGVSQTARPFTVALNQILPPFIAVVFLLALIVSVCFSRYITRPVIEISEASKRLAALDFDVACNEGRDDELGELAGNLNHLSRSLSSALEERNQANILLKEDVEREKALEGQQLAFFSAVSHELKTPVTILKGQLQGMIYRVGGYKDRDKYLKRAFEVTCSMEKLVMEILTVARIKSSGFALQPEQVRLVGFIRGILDDYEDLFQEKDFQVFMEANDMEDTRISIDKRLFAKAINNLISNAYYYSPRGAKICILIAGTEGKVQISIENTEVHIPEEEIPGLFEAFTRREQSRSRETGGSGLGLYIVRMVLDLHGFSYCLENTGEGVRFRIAID